MIQSVVQSVLLTTSFRACECWQERKVRERREAKREGEEEAGVVQKSIKKDLRRRRIKSVSQEGDPY